MQNDNLNPSTGASVALHFDLGTFEGFNFRHQGAIDRVLTAEEVVNWEHDAHGEAEFWPSGDHDGVSLLFRHRSAVTGRELQALDSLLYELEDDSDYTFLRIHHALGCCGCDLDSLTVEQVEDQPTHIFEGSNFTDLRREAALALFALYFTDTYLAWEKSLCDGLVFDHDRFLDSPSWHVEEVELGETKALIVVSN